LAISSFNSVIRAQIKYLAVTYMDDVKNMYWSDVINKEHAYAALDEFMKLLLQILIKMHLLRIRLLELLRLHGLMRN
jgi:hypothetical protein